MNVMDILNQIVAAFIIKFIDFGYKRFVQTDFWDSLVEARARRGPIYALRLLLVTPMSKIAFSRWVFRYNLLPYYVATGASFVFYDRNFSGSFVGVILVNITSVIISSGLIWLIDSSQEFLANDLRAFLALVASVGFIFWLDGFCSGAILFGLFLFFGFVISVTRRVLYRPARKYLMNECKVIGAELSEMRETSIMSITSQAETNTFADRVSRVERRVGRLTFVALLIETVLN
jgi:hypothetical protein